jgi:D-alanine-D-alanine ligase
MSMKRRNARIRIVSETAVPTGKRAPHLDLLMGELSRRLDVGVIFGGDKAARGAVLRAAGNPRSWKSYESVARDLAGALGRVGFEHVSVFSDDMRLPRHLKAGRVSLAWLNSGGVQGRNAISHTPSMLEMYGIPYVGHDPLTAALLDSKHHFKRQLVALGIPTAPFFVWSPEERREAHLTERRLKADFSGWPHGFVVKPVTGRASLHVHHVERAADLTRTIEQVYEATSNTVLVEAFLPGREYCVAVAGPTIARRGKLFQLPGPFAFSALERRLDPGEPIFTSMDVKPITAARTRTLDPSSDGDVIERLERMARQVYVSTPLQTLVRLDVRADARGELYVLEANPKPDLAAPRATSTSLICAGLDRYGMNYDDLVLSILADRVAKLFDSRDASVSAFFDQFSYAKAGRRS